jgi:uncharacterized protein
MLKRHLIGVLVLFVMCHSPAFACGAPVTSQATAWRLAEARMHGARAEAGGIDTVSAQDPPRLTAPVNDFAGVIDDETERELDRRIRALQRTTGDTVVVATVRTFQPYSDIASYAVKMFENGGRGIGERGKDNGLLIVAAVDDRRVRIETGYDLEAFITDGFAGDTIRTAMTPRFAAGEYGAGVLAGTTRIINRIAERRGVALEDVPRDAPAPQPSDSGFPIGLVFLLIIIVMSFIGRMGGGRRRRGGPWIVGGPWSGWNSGVGPFGGGGFGGGFGGFGGGGGGGGFGGFGGGRSGGGGASGSW